MGKYNRTNFKCYKSYTPNGMTSKERCEERSRIKDRHTYCPYSGRLLLGVELECDHVVPLKWAWEHGASEWGDSKLEQFGNDINNLRMVSPSLNRSKGDQGPYEWLPPNISVIREYVINFALICTTYGLSGFTLDDARAVQDVIDANEDGIKLSRFQKLKMRFFSKCNRQYISPE